VGTWAILFLCFGLKQRNNLEKRDRMDHITCFRLLILERDAVELRVSANTPFVDGHHRPQASCSRQYNTFTCSLTPPFPFPQTTCLPTYRHQSHFRAIFQIPAQQIVNTRSVIVIFPGITLVDERLAILT
jgi:hypothetical protein